MTRSITTKLALIFTVAVVALFASQANADIYNRIDRDAVKIVKKTKSLLNETIHYRHTPQYRQLVQCTQELSRLATHIHEVTHYEGNLFHLRADLRDLEAEFCLLEGFFDEVEYAASKGHGRIKGNTAHVKSLLNAIQRCIYDISDDVEKLVIAYERPVVVKKQVVVAKPVYAKPVYPVRQNAININISGNGKKYGHSRGRGYGYGKSNRGGGFGISIGGGSSQIFFGF